MRYCVYDLVENVFLKVLAVRLVLLHAGLPALVTLGLFAEHLDLRYWIGSIASREQRHNQ